MDEKNELLRRFAAMGIAPRVLDAFASVDRSLFAPARYREQAYSDHPLPLPEGQSISQPTTVILMSDALNVSAGMSVLEIGSGSGYQAAILAKLCAPGQVNSVETIPALVSLAQRNLRAAGITNATVSYGDGSQGFPAKAPYDRIIVTAAAPSVPKPLKDQLKEGGVMVIPVGEGTQRMLRITRIGDEFTEEDLGDFVFVPLVGKYGKK